MLEKAPEPAPAGSGKSGTMRENQNERQKGVFEMKKTLKRALTALIAAALLLSCLPLSSSADDLWVDADVDALWAEKMTSDPKYSSGIGEALLHDPIKLAVNDLTVLLYTDAFSHLTFERRTDFPDECDYICFPEGRSYLLLPCTGQVRIQSVELEEVLEPCVDEHLVQKKPYLRACIEAFGITKDELREACIKSKSDPDSIRDVLSAYTDEEFAYLKERGELKSALDENSYLLDALYLEDEAEMMALSLEPFAVCVAGKIVKFADVLYDSESRFEGQPVTEWLKNQNLNTRSFKRFLENAEVCGKSYQTEQNRLEERIAELKALAYADPPKTGDPTAAYALIFALAALPLAGFGVYEWKKRRRAV